MSLFSGAGGFCEGVRLAGWEVLCSVETDDHACRTYAANFPDVPLFQGDIADFLDEKSESDSKFEHLVSANVDVVYGGPPCQGFSQIGPRDVDDPRNVLYKHFVRVARAVQPRIFVMENVPNMITMKGGHFKDQIQEAFRAAGYARTTIQPVTASDFGVPQHRKRIFWFGIRDDLSGVMDLDTTVRKWLDARKVPHVTVKQAISDLPRDVSADDSALPYTRLSGRCSDYQKLMRLDWDTPLLSAAQKRSNLACDQLHNHHTKNVEARRLKIIKAIKPGARGDSLPAALWNGTREHKWRRLDPEKPSYTILAQMHRDLSEWIHPEYDRWITVREAARLQSFHDGFVFHGSELQQLKQVGNAVPPLVGLTIAEVAGKLLASVHKKRNGGAQG
ncbi:DNA cytosine methyltransferase [Burkholderia pseudomallei]|nr:DNA cytosine methyltransferase [Burkholderia pseudomallei]